MGVFDWIKVIAVLYIYCLGMRGIASLLSLEVQPRPIVGVESDNKLAILRGSSQ
jgi:hypothetical protein